MVWHGMLIFFLYFLSSLSLWSSIHATQAKSFKRQFFNHANRGFNSIGRHLAVATADVWACAWMSVKFARFVNNIFCLYLVILWHLISKLSDRPTDILTPLAW